MSAKVVETSFTRRDTLRVTTRDDAIPMKEVAAGTEITYSGHVISEITNEETGEIFTSIVVKSADGKLYATRSESFIKKIHEIMELIADEEPSDEPLILMITKGKSKNGREFVSCALA